MINKFVIKRSDWIRGEKSFYSFLLRERDNKKCCFGFLASACGVQDIHLLNIQSFAGLPKQYISSLGLTDAGFISWEESKIFQGQLFPANSVKALALMRVNDAPLGEFMPDEANREALITKGFAELGIQVTFVD